MRWLSISPRSLRTRKLRWLPNRGPSSPGAHDAGWRRFAIEAAGIRANGKVLDYARIFSVGSRSRLERRRRNTDVALLAATNSAVGKFAVDAGERSSTQSPIPARWCNAGSEWP